VTDHQQQQPEQHHKFDEHMGWDNPLNKDRRQIRAKGASAARKARVPHPIILPPTDPIPHMAVEIYGEFRGDKNLKLGRLSYNAQLTWWLLYIETLHRLDEIQESQDEKWTMRMVSEIIETTCAHLYGCRDWNARFMYWGSKAVECLIEAHDKFHEQLDQEAELPEPEGTEENKDDEN